MKFLAPRGASVKTDARPHRVQEMLCFGKVVGLAAFRLLHCRFGSLEPDAAVGAVTEWFGHRSATTAERKCRFAGQIILVTIGIHQFNRTFGVFHAIWAVLANGNLNCGHEASLFDMKIAEKKLSTLSQDPRQQLSLRTEN